VKEIPVDIEEMEKLKTIYQINHDELVTVEDAMSQLNVAKEKWHEMKVKGQEFREQELLDLYPHELTEELLSNEKKKKKVL